MYYDRQEDVKKKTGGLGRSAAKEKRGVQQVNVAMQDSMRLSSTVTQTGNKQIGKVVRAAASADTTVRVRLSQ